MMSEAKVKKHDVLARSNPYDIRKNKLSAT